MTEPIQYTEITDRLTCTRCGTTCTDDDYTIFYNSRVPVAILCHECEKALGRAGLIDYEEATLTLQQHAAGGHT